MFLSGTSLNNSKSMTNYGIIARQIVAKMAYRRLSVGFTGTGGRGRRCPPLVLTAKRCRSGAGARACPSVFMAPDHAPAPECLDILDKDGKPTGEVRPRKEVHRLGLWHRAVHTWLFCPATKEVLLQRRATNKESFPDLWDVSSAGHIIAGDTSINTAVKEMEEELGIEFPESAFEYLFQDTQQSVLNGGTYLNNEFADVYLVTVPEPVPKSAFTLQESEVSDVRWMEWREYQKCLLDRDPNFVPFDASADYANLFSCLEEREAT